jgi:predicted dehydrogenase
MINRILIVGYGSIGKRHLRLMRELVPNADIRVLRHEKTYEIPEFSNGCFFSIDEAIAFGPQVAIIASPAPFHIPTAMSLASVGVHLLVEKPLSSSLNGVLDLIKLCKKKNIILMIGYNLRFLPSLQKFRDFLHNNIIGKILSVRCEVGQYLPSWRPDNDYRNGASARRRLGGGVLLELSHELDYLRWIFGEIDWVKATLSRQSALEIDVEDTAHLTLGFAPTLDQSQLIGDLSLDFIRHDATRLCTAIGEKGSLRWNALDGQVSIYEVDAKNWRELFCHRIGSDDSYIAELNSFIECVMNHKSPMISGEDGLKVLQVVEAARNSESSSGLMSKVETLDFFWDDL